MSTTLAQNDQQRSGGRFKEAPLTIDAEPLNNLLCVVDDVLKKTAQAARAHFQIANELQRDAQRLSRVRSDALASISDHGKRA